MSDLDNQRDIEYAIDKAEKLLAAARATIVVREWSATDKILNEAAYAINNARSVCWRYTAHGGD